MNKRKRKKQSPEYMAYHQAKYRCTNSRAVNFHRYGGRGIQFLFSSFDEFMKNLGQRPSSNHSLDRINNDGNYCVENCRWATKLEQHRNRSCSLYINGVFHKDIDSNLGGVNLVKNRIKLGWKIEDAITFKPRQKLKEIPAQKVCIKCKIEKPINEYTFSKTETIPRPKSECKVCIRKRYQQNKHLYELN
jgi:hypothetical protein